MLPLKAELKQQLTLLRGEDVHSCAAVLCILSWDITELTTMNLSNENYIKSLHKVFEAASDLGHFKKCFQWLKSCKNGTLKLETEHKNPSMLYLLKLSLKMEKVDEVIDLFIKDAEVESNFT